MTELDDGEIEATIRSVLTIHPVSVGYVFGSLARGEAHRQSDVDVAVAFEQDAEESAGERVLSLGADLMLELGTDDVDVIDLRRAVVLSLEISLSLSLARRVLSSDWTYGANANRSPRVPTTSVTSRWVVVRSLPTTTNRTISPRRLASLRAIVIRAGRGGYRGGTHSSPTAASVSPSRRR